MKAFALLPLLVAAVALGQSWPVTGGGGVADGGPFYGNLTSSDGGCTVTNGVIVCANSVTGNVLVSGGTVQTADAGFSAVGGSVTGQTFNSVTATGIASSQIAPGVPTVVPTCTGTCATTYFYCTTAVTAGGESVCSADGTTAAGNATLNGSTQYNTLNWTAPAGATSQNVYLCTTSACTTTNILGSVSGTAATYKDSVGSSAGAAAVTQDQSGSITAKATTGNIGLKLTLGSYLCFDGATCANYARDSGGTVSINGSLGLNLLVGGGISFALNASGNATENGSLTVFDATGYNSVRITGSTTGNPVKVVGNCSDTDCALELEGQGAKVVTENNAPVAVVTSGFATGVPSIQGSHVTCSSSAYSVTFSPAFSATPLSCLVNSESAAVTTAVTVTTESSSTLAGACHTADVLDWVCIGAK